MEHELQHLSVFWACLARGETDQLLAQELIGRVGIKTAYELLTGQQAGKGVDHVVGAVLHILPELAAKSGTHVRRVVSRWMQRAPQIDVTGVLSQTQKLQAGVLTATDPLWPSGLTDLANPPFALWYRGDLQQLQALGVGIVGARAASAYGQQVASQWAYEIAARDYTVVSGGAYGIDGAAHRGALGAQGNTAAVLAGGIDVLYPAGHTDLLQKIAQRGVLLTEKPPGSRPMRHTFLERNRLIAALSDAVVVVEASYRSGALNTVKHAHELNRQVMAVPGSVLSTTSAGCHRLIAAQEAQLVTGVPEILELIGPLELFDESTETQRRILAALSTAQEHSALADSLELSPQEVHLALANLELRGMVKYRHAKWSLV